MNYKITKNLETLYRIKKKKTKFLVRINPSRGNLKTRSLKICLFKSHYLVKKNLDGLVNYLKVKTLIKLGQKEVLVFKMEI